MALLARPRILEPLFATASGATLLTAGSGYGKSVAVRQYLAATTRNAIHYEVRPSSKTFVPFVRGFVDAAARTIPSLQTTFPGAIEFAMQSPKPYEEIAVWLLDHLSGSSAEVIAIEDAHHAGADEQVRKLLARLMESTGTKLRWLFTSRDSASVPLDEVAAAGVPVSTVDEAQLRFTRAEAEIVARDAGLARELTEELFRLTDGWPAAFHLGAHVFDGGRMPSERTYEFFAQAYFVRCREDVQGLLMGAAVLSDIDEELLEKSPWAACLERVRELARNGLVFTPRAGGRYVFHELFRKFLLERIGPQGSGGRRSAMMYGASLLERCGRIADALSLYEHAQDVANVVRICSDHGFELVDQGRVDLIRRSIALAGDEQLHKSPILMALRAIDEAQSGRHDTSESWYVHALELAGEKKLRATIAYRYALDLIGQGRQSINILEPYAGESELTGELFSSILSALATGYVIAGRFDDARDTISRALRLIPQAEGDGLKAKIFQHAAWVSIFTGDVAAAKRYGNQAVQLAISCGLFGIAARAYSVLYNIAAELEDDPNSALEILNKIWDCGLKCGEQKLRLYALLGSFDVAVELGDIENLLRIERSLEAYEVDYADKMIDEALLPGQALRMAAAGEFREAFQLLAPSAERQTSDDRRAWKYAELSLYASAAGLSDKAESAIEAVLSSLPKLDERLSRTMQTKAIVSVALYLMGRLPESKSQLTGLSALRLAASPRIRKLLEALDVLYARWEGSEDHAAVLEALEGLRAADLGGLAAVLAALPHRIAVAV